MLAKELKKQENKKHDFWVKHYQQTGECEKLIKQYEPFLNSYMNLFKNGIVDNKNKSINKLIQRFIIENKKKLDIKYDKGKAIQSILKIKKIINLSEIYNYLIITLLILAKRYENEKHNFTYYLYASFSYELYRQIEYFHTETSMSVQSYYDPYCEGINEPTTSIEEEIVLYLDDEFQLMHPDWLSGKIATEPFKSMTKDERYVLVKYYEPRSYRKIQYTCRSMSNRKIDTLYKLVSDTEIGQLLGKHRKSINRIRTKAINRLKKDWDKGEKLWVKIRKNY